MFRRVLFSAQEIKFLNNINHGIIVVYVITLMAIPNALQNKFLELELQPEKTKKYGIE